MLIRRSLLATALVAGTMTAATSPTASAEIHVRAGLSCATDVLGFTPKQKFRYRSVENNKVLINRRSDNSLPFRPTSATFVKGGKIDETTWRDTFATLNSDGKPRLVQVETHSADDTMTLTHEKMKNSSSFPGRLVADSGNPRHEYIVDREGNLERWVIHRTDEGRLSWDDPVLLSRKMGNLTTLTWRSRYEIGGVKKDVLWATTRAGALMQLQVPAAKPKALEVTVVKKHGFRNVTGLSAGDCNRKVVMGSLIMLEPSKNRARWVTIANEAAPRAANVRDRGLVEAELNWRLHATL